MAEPPAADNFEPLIEFVENLRMVPATQRAATVHSDSGEALLVEAGTLANNEAEPDASDPPAHPLHDRLHELLDDDALLRRISARQLYSLFSLAGTLKAATKQRFLEEVARRRETDPSNYHLRLLADELRG